jgi:uncharacterized delta-60 repeat protein
MKSLNTLLILTLLLFAAVSVSFSQTCPGTAGCLDQTFGSGGKTFIAAPNGTLPQNILTQSDGKVVTMGRGLASSGHKITRINADGTPDSTFGSGGIATFVWSGGNANDFAFQVVGGQERILVAGIGTVPSGRKSIIGRLRIDRLLPDGSSDPSWGNNGVLTVDLNSAYGIAVQPDQKILLTSASYGTLTRLNANGSVDTSFGSSGVTNSGDGQEIRLDASGRIYVSGVYQTGKGNNVRSYYFIRRFSPFGVLDTNFGINGVALSRPATTRLFYMALDLYGNTILGSTENADLRVERFDPNGHVDASFSTDGYVSLDFAGGGEGSAGVYTDEFGRVIVAGNVTPAAVLGGTDVGVYRLNYDGSLDSAFGNGGKVGLDIAGYYDYFGSVVLQTDPVCACQKIVIAAGTTGGSENQYTFARFTTQ